MQWYLFLQTNKISDILEHNGACNGHTVIVLLVFLSVQLLVKRNTDKLNFHKLLGYGCQSHLRTEWDDEKGTDISIPLSPQWLLPKPGENRTGAVTGENHFTPCSLNTTKPPGAGEDLNDNQNKKYVFRPSILDMESDRRERWHDEERDTNFGVRKDRWRDGEREHGGNRKLDRWTDSTWKQHGEVRRIPGEWWNDSTNKEGHRDNKWNSRWGPNDKETDALHEMWGDSNKEADLFLDKGSYPLNSIRKNLLDIGVLPLNK